MKCLNSYFFLLRSVGIYMVEQC